MHSDISTSKASKKLQEDLGLDYGLGSKIVSQFFDHQYTMGNGNYWTEKSNYIELVRLNGTIDYIKKRVRSKIKKHWNTTLELFLPDSKDRRNLYMKVYKKRLERKQKDNPLPNKLLQEILVKNLGHWDLHHHKGIKDNKHPKIPEKSIDKKLVVSI